MADVTRERRIDVGADQVWAALADFGTISTWAPNVDHSSILRSGGTTDEHLDTIRRVQVGRMALLERIVRWDDEKVLAYEIEGLPKVVRSVRNEWRLEADRSSGTRVSLTSTIDCGPRPPQQLIARIVARRLAGDSDKMLAGLADHLEHPHG